MKLIIVRRGRKNSLTLDSAHWRDRGALFLVIMLPLLLGVVLHAWYLSNHSRGSESSLLSQWREAMGYQVASAEAVRTQATHELDALQVKMAELQARIMRLDALGEQLVEVSALDGGEFDFSRRPAIGGPRQPAAPQHLDAVVDAPLQTDAGHIIAPLSVSFSSLEQRLADLTFHVDSQEQQLAVLDRELAMRESRIETFVAGRPVKKGWMSSAFGERTDPFTGKLAWHEGVDSRFAHGQLPI